MEECNVKKWYSKEFPDELEFAEDIDETLTFEEIYKCFIEEKEWNKRVSETLDKFSFDSDVRDRILEEVNKRFKMKDDEIFDIYDELIDDHIKKNKNNI